MKYKVIATWGAQKYTTELGEFATMEEAMDRVNRWQDAPEVEGMQMDLIEVIRVTQSTVYSAHTAPSDCGEDGGETQEQYDIMNSESDIRSLKNEVLLLRHNIEALRAIQILSQSTAGRKG